MLSLGVAGVRPPGGVGSGQGDGCPTRVSQNCAGCRLGAVRRVPGAGSRLSARPRPRAPGRWKGEELHRNPGGEPGGFQVPGSRESWHSGEDSLHLQTWRGLLALRGARSSLPPPGVRLPWGARDHPEASGSPAWDLAATQLASGSRHLPESRAPAEAGADSAGQSGFTGCPSVP